MILNKYLTEKYVTKPAIITAIASLNKSILGVDIMLLKFLIISTKNDPAVTGKNIKNEKWAASSLDNLFTFPPKIVDPLLYIPGNTPTPWNKPIDKALKYDISFNVFLPFIFLLASNKNPVTMLKHKV